MSATLINIIIQIVAGAIGGNGAGAALKDMSLGPLGNTIAGALGGLGGGQLLSAPAVGVDQGASLAPAGAWWTALGDPQLDRIMADALAGSPSLDTAMARLRIAHASIEADRASLLPQISADASESRVRISDKYTVPPPYAGTGRWMRWIVALRREEGCRRGPRCGAGSLRSRL